MSSPLPISVERLLRGGVVESERIEFKADWDSKTVGPQVLRTICAFANDYYEVNGGYVVLGVEEENERAVLPPRGLTDEALQAARKWIRTNCRRLDPPYVPIMSAEEVAGRRILVVWVPASLIRPHRAPAMRRQPARYWVRLGAETVDAEQRGDLLRNLIAVSARVPWDDRPAHGSRTSDLSAASVREHLRAVASDLHRHSDEAEIYRRMRLTMRTNGEDVPVNAALLLFSRDPTEWIRGAKIEVVHFHGEPSGDILAERTFHGGMLDQLQQAISYLDGQLTTYLQKQTIRSKRWRSFPMPAVRELLVNAVMHRGYGPENPDPIRVFIYPGRLVVGSYPGPMPGWEPRHFLPGASLPVIPSRNRRIAEFLMEREFAEGRFTGLEKVFLAMRRNGSPVPVFEFDAGRTYFQATLPAHPKHVARVALREAAELSAAGRPADAARRIETAWEAHPDSTPLAQEFIRLQLVRGDLPAAEAALTRARARSPEDDPSLAEARALIARARSAAEE